MLNLLLTLDTDDPRALVLGVGQHYRLDSIREDANGLVLVLVKRTLTGRDFKNGAVTLLNEQDPHPAFADVIAYARELAATLKAQTTKVVAFSAVPYAVAQDAVRAAMHAEEEEAAAGNALSEITRLAEDRTRRLSLNPTEAHSAKFGRILRGVTTPHGTVGARKLTARRTKSKTAKQSRKLNRK